MDTIAPPRLTEPKMVALAREVAMNIIPIDTVLSGLGLTLLDLEMIQHNPRFIALVQQMSVEWGATLNTAERVKVKSQALLEDTLPELHNLLHNSRESMAAKVEALKLLKTLGGIGDRDPSSVLAPERFHLEIHIGEGKPQVINVTPGPHNLRQLEAQDVEAVFTPEVNSELSGGLDE